MSTIRSPEPGSWSEDSNNRVEKTACLIDDVSESFVMSVGEISLEGSGFDSIDWQDAQQYWMTRERFLI